MSKEDYQRIFAEYGYKEHREEPETQVAIEKLRRAYGIEPIEDVWGYVKEVQAVLTTPRCVSPLIITITGAKNRPAICGNEHVCKRRPSPFDGEGCFAPQKGGYLDIMTENLSGTDCVYNYFIQVWANLRLTERQNYSMIMVYRCLSVRADTRKGMVCYDSGKIYRMVEVCNRRC